MSDEATPGAAPSAPADPATLSPEQATAEISRWNNEIADNQNHPYRDHRNPNHKSATDRMMALYARAGGAAGTNTAAAIAGTGATAQPGSNGPAADDMSADTFSFERVRPRPDLGSEDFSASLEAVRGWATEAKIEQLELDTLIGRHNELARNPALHDPAHIKETQVKSLAGLKAIWPGPEFETKVKAAQRAVARLDAGAGNLKWLLEDTRLGDDPYVIRMLAEVGERNQW